MGKNYISTFRILDLGSIFYYQRRVEKVEEVRRISLFKFVQIFQIFK